MRFFSERIASFEPTVLDLMISDISRLSAMSSLYEVSRATSKYRTEKAYNELEVALSICSSNWDVDANHPAIMLELASPRLG